MKRVFYVCSIFFLYILSVFNCSPNSVLAGERTDKLIWGAGKSSSYEMGTLSPADEKIVNNLKSKVDLNKNPQAFFIINGGTVGNHDGGVNNFPLTLTTKYSYNVKAKPGEKLTFTVNGIRGIEPEVERAITINGKLVNGKDVGRILTEHTTSVWFVVVTYDSKGKEISSQKTKEITTGKISNGTMTWTMPKNTNLVKISACYNAKSKKKYNSGGFPISETIIASYSITPTNFTSAANQTNTAKQKTGGNPQNSKDSDISTITIVVGTVAAGVLGWGAMQFFGRGGTAGASSTIPGGGSIPDNPYYKKDGEDLIYTDPATGAQSIYSQDSERNWVNVETGGVLDLGRIDEVTSAREADKIWNDEQFNKLKNKDTAQDKALENIRKKIEEENARIERETARDIYAINTGQYGLTHDELKARLDKTTEKAAKDFKEGMERAKIADKCVVGLTVVQTTADTAIGITSRFVPGMGSIIANVYTVAKDVAGSSMEGAIRAMKEDGVLNKLAALGTGAGQGAVNAAIDYAQGNVKAAKWKALSNIGGEAFKSVLDSAIKGENKTKALATGLGKGVLKQGITVISDTLSGNAMKSENVSAQKAIKTLWHNAGTKQSEIINNYTKRLIACEKANKLAAIAEQTNYNGNPVDIAIKMRDNLMHMNAQKFFNEANSIRQGVKNVGNTIQSVGDLAQGANDFAFNDEVGLGAERWKH